jgi:hypothetical protein
MKGNEDELSPEVIYARHKNKMKFVNRLIWGIAAVILLCYLIYNYGKGL